MALRSNLTDAMAMEAAINFLRNKNHLHEIQELTVASVLIEGPIKRYEGTFADHAATLYWISLTVTAIEIRKSSLGNDHSYVATLFP